jgi:hypothetical protein
LNNNKKIFTFAQINFNIINKIMRKICPVPTKGIDDVIANKVQGWTEKKVANLRGMYEEEYSVELDMNDLDQATKTLVNYRKDLNRRMAEEIKSKGNNIAQTFKDLKEEFPPVKLFNRVNMIATMFSKALDNIQSRNPRYSREDICNGVIINGKVSGGQFFIFDQIYNALERREEALLQEGKITEAKEIEKVLDNWSSLVTYARVRIREVENIKLGNNISYGYDSVEDDFGDSVDIDNLFNPEESTREHWQEANDMKSSFGTIGQNVRRVLSNISISTDDLGFAQNLDPVKSHQTLLDLLYGCRNSRHMMRKLKQLSKTGNITWLSPLYQYLENNPTYITQFYVDLKRNFQLYSGVRYSNSKSKFINFFYNRKDSQVVKQYLSNIKYGKIIRPENSIYDDKGRIKWDNLERTLKLIADNFNIDDTNVFKASQFFKEPLAKKVFVLYDILTSLGVNIEHDTVITILHDGKAVRQLAKLLKELKQYGFDSVLSKNDKEALKNGSFKSTFYQIVRRTTGSNKTGNIQEKLEKILDITYSHQEQQRMDSRARYKDKNGNTISLFSHVNPCYMGDKLESIQSFVKEGDKEGLKNMLESEFLNSSYFRDENGYIFNRWIRDLYEECTNPNSDIASLNGFASNFLYDRFISYDDIDFENLTSKQHALSLFSRYTQFSSQPFAYYPVFVLGDSGVSKFIKARKYSEDDILNGLVDVYRQEIQRMSLTKSFNNKLEQEGYSKLANFSEKEGVFTMLPFFNKDYVSKDNIKGKYHQMLLQKQGSLSAPTYDQIKEVISEYLKDELANFKKSLFNLELLQVDSKGVYTDMNAFIKGNDIDAFLKDYYLNTKFANIQQFQMMTIDTAYYVDTKDFQKRYKQIHAPGTKLDVYAQDKNGNLYNSLDNNGNPRAEFCIYFKELKVTAEDVNPEFAEAIASKFGKDSEVYKDYMSIKSTDGQGYRTLDSYRKVMGMAGKWTDEMENAYNEIKNIRSRYDNFMTADINTADLQRIADLAVVFQPIKPFMYTIENYPINESDVLKIPVQHKYAEVVLIPELLRKGSMLRDMAYWMENRKDANGKSSPVDLIVANSAVKVGAFGEADISKANDTQSLNSALDKAYVHQLSFDDFRLQTNVTEHINSSQLFGTQFRKLIMAHIDVDEDYSKLSNTKDQRVNLGGNYGRVKLNGRNLVTFYNSLVVANILEAQEEFENSIQNTDDVSKLLIQNTINNSRESLDNILAFSIDEDGKIVMPLFEPLSEHDSAALLLSVFKKKVNKQAIKGGSAVQASSLGIKDYEKSGDLEYVTDDEKNILYAQCEIPWDLSFTDSSGRETPLKYEDYCNSNGELLKDNDGNTLLEKKFPGILDMIAYRIPTEREYSMVVLKVKKFTSKTAGGIIRVPAPGIKTTGFDFDVDKLYFMRKEYKVHDLSEDQIQDIWNNIYKENPHIKYALNKTRDDLDKIQKDLNLIFSSKFKGTNAKALSDIEIAKDRLWKYWKEAGLEGNPSDIFNAYLSKNIHKYTTFEKYDCNKTALQNTRAARNNMLIDIAIARLQSPSTFEARYTPGAFKRASKAARIMRELVFGNTKNFMHNGSIDFHELYEVIKDESTDPEPNYDPSDPFTLITYNQQNQIAGKLIGIFANQNTNHAFASLMKRMALKSPIEFCNHSYGDGKNSSLLVPPQGIDVTLHMAEFLAASVDAVKDPVLNFLNLNTITADAGALLARIGYTTEEIGYLFNQPIIKELCEIAFNENKGAIEAIKILSNKYTTKTIGKTVPQIDFSKEVLAKNIVEYRQSIEDGKNLMEIDSFKINQLKVLNLFSSILNITSDVTDFVTATKFTAANSVGSTFGDLYNQQMRVQEYINKDSKLDIEVVPGMIKAIDNSEVNVNLDKESYMNRVLDKNNPMSYEQAMFDMNRRSLKALSKYYPYENREYKEMRKYFLKKSKYKSLDASLINSMHMDLLVFKLSQYENGPFNGDKLKVQENGEEITFRDYFTKYFAKEVYDMYYSDSERFKDLKDYDIFKYMFFSVEDNQSQMSLQDIGGLLPHQKEAIKNSWEELLNNRPGLAKCLFLYNFYNTGFTFTPLSFLNLAPTRLKETIEVEPGVTFRDFLYKTLNGENFNQREFFEQFIRNHSEYYNFTYSVKGPVRNRILSNCEVYIDGSINDEFDLDIDKLGDFKTLFTISEEGLTDNEVAFVPMLNIDGYLFICDNNDFNISTNGIMRYKRVDNLGTTNVVTKYYNPNYKTSKSPSKKPISNNSNVVNPPYQNPSQPTSSTLNRDKAIEDILTALVNRGDIMREDAEIAKKVLSQESDDSLKQGLEELKLSINDYINKNGLTDATGDKVC